MKNKIFKIYL